MVKYKMLCASIYQFYVKRNERSPELMTFWLTSVIFIMNFWAIYEVLSLFIFRNLPSSTEIIYYICGVVLLGNYLLGFRSDEYKSFKFENGSGIKVIIYMIISVLSLAVLAKVHHDRSVEAKSDSAAVEATYTVPWL